MLHKRVPCAGDRAGGRPRVPRRMRLSRLGLLFAVALLPLVLWAALPVLSDGLAALARGVDRLEDRPEAPGDRAEEGPRARALDDGRALQPQHRRAAGRHHGAAAQAGPDPGRPRRQARGARPHPGGAAPGAHPPRAAAGAAGRGARRARRPPRRALQGRQARRRHRRAQLGRLRRPARPHRVHAARVGPGRAHHRPRPHRARRGDADRRRTSTRSRSARPRSPRRSRRGATRSRASAGSSSTAATSSPPCAPTRRPRWPARATAASTSRATSPRSRPPTRASSRSSPPPRTARRRPPPGPIRPGSGGLIWPVNGPIVSPFGMRWGRLHAGVDIAVPGRHADPRREVRHGPSSWAGPAATATTPASATAAGSPPVTRTSRATGPPSARASARAR